jgi:diadenylate cyclase
MIDWQHFFYSLFEIIALTWAIHFFLCHIWNSRLQDLIVGLSIIASVYIISGWLDLPVIHAILSNFISWAGLGIFILLQPEIRLAIAKIGTRGQKYQEITEFDTFVEGLAQCVFRLADKRVGALILVENNDNLDEFANKAVRINAFFTQELLESIFIPTTPLHDGAVIIRGTQILSAATILPLAEDISQVTKSMGTRHRAGLGISQRTDALVIVISEETGRVSIAIDGIMTRGVKIDRFRSILRSIFAHPQIKRRSLMWFKK